MNCPCLLCQTEVLLRDDYEGYVPGYWVICPDCLNKPEGRLWLDPFTNFVEIAETFKKDNSTIKVVTQC